MKTILSVLSALALSTGSAFAATETVDGIEWTYTVKGGVATLGGGSSSTPAIPSSVSGAVAIPSALGGVPVTVVSAYAFCDRSAVTSFAIPNTVTNIGSYAFQNCAGLTEVDVPKSVQTIGQYAFSGCANLRSMTLPFVGTRRGYTNTYEDDFGSVFGSSSHSGFSSVRQHYYYKNGSSYSTTYTDYNIPSGLVSVTVTDDTYIPDYAFENCTMLTNIVVNDEVAGIGSDAFNGCTRLRNHPIPAGAATIGAYAFSGCSALAEIDLPETITKVGQYAFKGCTGAKSLTIPNSVTNIGQYAFQNCAGLTAVEVPESVQAIGYNAFGGCPNLHAMTLPFVGSRRGNADGYGDNFGFIFGGSSSSTGCSSVRQYYYYSNGTQTSYSTYYIPTNLVSVTITDETELRPYAFQNCWMLTNIAVNGGVTGLGSYAFSDCTRLQNHPIPAGVAMIGSYAFQSCTALEEIDLPDNVRKVSDYAFSGCSAVTALTIPNSVTNIGQYAFQNCAGLTEVEVPESVQTIGSYAFSGCAGLRSMTLPFVGTRRGYTNTYEDDFGSVFGSSSHSGFSSVRQHYYYKNGSSYSTTYTDYNIPSGLVSMTVTDDTYIPDYAFENCTMLTNIVVNDEVAGIGSYAFSGCTGLRDFTIPASAKSIGSYAFSGCTGLAEITIPESVTSIGQYAFQNCSNLASIRILSENLTIDQYAFSGCPASIYDTTTIPGVKLIDGWAVGFTDALSGDVDLSSVKDISQGAFNGNRKITSVILPNNLATVPYNAFYNCTSLRTVTIPDTVTRIDGYAFSGCTALQNPVIPESVTSIGSYAFYNCQNITAVNLPEGLKTIGEWAFYNTAIRSLSIPEGVTSVGQYAFYNCKSLTSVSFPASLTRIPNYAFQSCTKLASITLPEGVVSVGRYAFANCTGMKTVTLPTTLSSCGEYAFSGDTAITAVNISDLAAWCGIVFGNAEANPAYYAHALTLGGEVIHDLVVPDGLQKLNAWCFSDNYALTSVTVPEGIPAIPRSAFNRCAGITNAVLPESLADIGMYAFQSCNGLTGIDLPAAVTNIADYAFNGSTNLVNVAYPKSLATIGAYAFAGCKCLVSAELPSDLQSIGNYTFQNCAGFTEIEIPPSVKSIGQYAFHQCGNLTNLIVHSDLTSIGNSAFAGCNRLSVFLADDVTTIWPSLFRYCGGVTNVVFTEAVTNIDNYAFYNCSTLAGLELPAKLKRIGQYAFYGCTGLPEVVIPEGVTTIGQYAFANCTKLVRASLPSSVKSVGQYAFSGCSRLAGVELAEGSTSIGSYAFQNCTNLKEVDLPETVKTIGEYAFAGCTGLESASLPEGLTSIGNHAFRNCRKLSDVVIPSSVSRIGSYAFEGCTSILELNVPEGVSSIGDYAFNACTNLAALSIPASVTNIGWYAFAACSNLTEVTLLTKPSRVVPTADISLTSSDWSIADGDTIQADSRKFRSGIKQNTTGAGVLSFEWKTPGYWYYDNYYRKDYFSSYGYFHMGVDYWNSYYSSGWSYSESCETDAWATKAISVSGNGNHTIDWSFEWDFYQVGEGIVDPAADFGRIRSLSFVQGRAGGTGVDGTVVGASAFDGCVNLECVNIEDVGAWCGTIFENAWANPLHYAKRLCVGGEEVANLVIPETVTAVSGWAFADCGSITNIVFPSGLTSVGTHAFQRTAIGDISLPTSVTNIGSFAFAGCDGVKVVALSSNFKKIGDFAFAGQTKVVTATVPGGTELSKYLPDSLATIESIAVADGETAIVPSAFAGCVSLETIDIPDTVKTIGQSAFRDCASLTSVEIPSSVTAVWYNAFNGCLRLKSIGVHGDNYSYSSETGVLFDERGAARRLFRCPEGLKATAYSIPEGVARVDGYAFQNCAVIETVAIPASVTNIGTRAFSGCTALVAFDVSDDNPAFKTIDGVLFTNDGKTLLRFPPAKTGHYDIPDGVATIAPYAFEGCGRLASLSFGQDVRTIGAHAFDSSPAIAQVILNDGLESIGDYAFNGCALLSALTIPESVTSLGEGAFDGCDSLESLAVPENITVKPKKIGGIIRGNVSLYKGCVYNVTNNLMVMGGATLKIPAGVVLKMNPWYSIGVAKGGHLVASGTRAAPVIITSILDDEFGGDTNGDGNATEPQGGDWGDVTIQGKADLSHVRIRYGEPYNASGLLNVLNYQFYYGYDYYYYSDDEEWTDYVFYDDDAELTMEGCSIEHASMSWGVGLYNDGGSVVAKNCVFSDLPSAVHGYGRYDDARSGYYSYYTMAGQTNHFVNCVFHGCDSVIQDAWYNIDTTAAVFDNCAFSEMVEWVGDYGESIPSHFTFRNCCFWNPEDDEFYPIQTNRLIGVSGNIWGDPRFANPEAGDFHITTGSACIDMGREEDAPARDYFGQPRNGTPDIGIHEIQLRPVNDYDLAALAVFGDAEAAIGGTISVRWTVGNVGTTNIVDDWRDVLELVDSTGRTVELGQRTVFGGLNAGANLSFTSTFAVPSMSPGPARLRLKVNPYRDVYEGSLTANNICLAEEPVEILLPAYSNESDSDVSLRAGGSIAFRVPAESGVTTFRIAPKPASGVGAGTAPGVGASGAWTVSAYALAGGVPAGLRYDVSAVAISDGSLLLVLPEDAHETDYNVAVFNDGLSVAEVELTPLSDHLSVFEATPSRLANTGDGHMMVLGIGMDRVSAVRLEGPQTIVASDFRAASPAQLSATFNLSGAAVGSYALVLVDKDGVSHRTGMTVDVYSPKVGPKLEAWLELPSSTRQGRVYTGRICYRNSGDEDMAAPCLSLTVANGMMGLAPDEITLPKLDVLAIGNIAPHGMLKAGEESRIDFWFKSGAQPQFQLDKLDGSSDVWNSYVETMSQAATVLNSRGRKIVALEDLLPYIDAAESGDNNLVAICGTVSTIGETSATIEVRAETLDGKIVAIDEVDENGVFVLDGLANGSNYVVRVEGNSAHEPIIVTTPDNGDTHGVTLVATGERQLHLSIVGIPEEEEPKGMFILYNDDAEEIASGEINETVTVGYVSTNLEDVIYIDCTLESGRKIAACEVVSPYDADLGMDAIVDFSDSSLVTGVVTLANGEIATDAIVRLRSPDYGVETANMVSYDGSYAIGGLEPGIYYLDAKRGSETSDAVEIEIVAGEDLEENVIIPCPNEISVSVEIQNCKHDAILMIEQVDGDFTRNFFVSNCVFDVKGLTVGRYEFTILNFDGFALGQTVCASLEGETSIVLQAANCHSVSGQMRNPAGTPLSGVISLIPEKGARYILEVGEDGVFESEVPAGRYWLICRSFGCESKSCYIDVNASIDLDVTLSTLVDESIDNDIEEGELLPEYNGAKLQGNFVGTGDVIVEFIDSAGGKIAMAQVNPPNGIYSISNAPTDFAYVWMTDFKSTGILKTREEFCRDSNAIDFSDPDLTSVEVHVYADPGKSIPLHGATVWMTGAHSNVVTSTTDSAGRAFFRLSQGSYSLCAFRVLAAKGDDTSVVVSSKSATLVEYTLPEANETAATNWMQAKRINKQSSRLFVINRKASGWDNVVNGTLDAISEAVIPPPIRAELDANGVAINLYASRAAQMVKDPPVLECKHNLAIWKVYRVARLKFERAESNASYDLQLCRNAWSRLCWLIAYKAPGYIPGVGWAYSLTSTGTEMVADGLAHRQRNNTRDGLTIAESSCDAVSPMEEYTVMDPEYAAQIEANNAQIAKNEKTLSNLRNQARNITNKLNKGKRLSKKSATKLIESYNKTVAKIAEVEAKNAELVTANSKMQKGWKDAGRWIDNARLTKKANWTKASKLGKLGKAGGAFLLGLNLYLDWKDIEPHYNEVVRYTELLVEDMADLESAFYRLEAAYNAQYHSHPSNYHEGETNKLCLVERICPASTNGLDMVSLNTPISCDPNEIVGPMGVGDAETERFVKPGEELSYTIYFENKSDAETAAQEIKVTESLDPRLDWSTFQLGEIAFNNQIDNGLSGRSEGVSEVKLNGTDYYVRTEATCDPETGKVSWYLRIVDKTTPDEWPTDLHAGILPPNDETFRGEGHITYRVKVLQGAVPGSRIDASATIVFDYNDPIPTDPSWWNTVAQVATVTVECDPALFEDGAEQLSLVVGQPYGKLPAPKARAGYSFDGWYTGPNGTGKKISVDMIVESGVTGIYAHWVQTTYSVVFDANGGAGKMAAQKIAPGATAKLLANKFTKSGCVFLGWAKTKTGAVAYANGASVKNLAAAGKSVTLYAQWAVAKYKIAFNGNGGKLPKKKKMKALAMTYGMSKKLPKNLFARKGYVFIGWSTKKKGPVEFPNKASVKNLTTKDGTVTLYAQWAKEKYKVAFYANGGKGKMATQAMTYGKAKKLSANKFKAPKGMKFAGWAKSKADAKKGKFAFKDKKSVKNLVTTGKTVKLYAVWKKK